MKKTHPNKTKEERDILNEISPFSKWEGGWGEKMEAEKSNSSYTTISNPTLSREDAG